MSVSVSCRPGEQLLGGGFAASDLFEYAAYIEASYPSDALTWTVTASAPTSFFDLEADVYCLPATTPLGVQIVRADGPTASCPQDTVLLGGGVQGSRPVAVSRPQGNGWLGSASDPSIAVYALCARDHVQRGQVVGASFNAHSSSHSYAPGGADAACPAGEIAGGGGFDAGGDLVVGSQSRGSSFTGWSVVAGGDTDVTISAVCVRLQA